MKATVKFAAFAAVFVMAAGAQADSSASGVKQDSHAKPLVTSADATSGGSHDGMADADDSHGGSDWGYEGEAGPAQWSSLSGDYRLCGEGAAQSPINIESFSGASVQPIEFDYRLTTLSIVHNGHTVQVNYAPGSSITVAGKRFELLQFHFHTPSEHAVAGKQTVMEVHFVHRAADGSLAVVGAMMESGEENLALREIWSVMPRKPGPARQVPNTLINARDLLPRDTGYYRYMGSLTTPPCSEGVNWYVLNEPISVSVEQAEKFVAAAGENARPLQPVNNRLVLAPMADN